MTDEATEFEVVIIGSGPAGQKAAIQASKAGRRVLLIERDKGVGGACVHKGTIPSKTLRETAVYFEGFTTRTLDVIDTKIPGDVRLTSLMSHVERVIKAHECFLHDQLRRNNIEQWHGRARFVSSQELEVTFVRGNKRIVKGHVIVIATGSHPRSPDDVPVDHEHILDSDSILSTMYVPKSLTVLGSGVVACEYASIFAALGVEVTIIDKFPAPMGFLDPDLTSRFVEAFESRPGCRFLGNRKFKRVHWDGIDSVVTELDDGTVIKSEKMLCALGRGANLAALNIEAAGLAANDRGFLDVNQHCQTAVPHIYAAGDVIGPPALASTSMEQGRRAARHALGVPVEQDLHTIPVGIFAIPEMSCVGMTEQQVTEREGGAMVGTADFAELARGQIAGATDGFLKLVSDAKGQKVMGVQILGAGATELVHVGQMAMLAGYTVDVFVEVIFNFPTLAEAYRVAALDIVGKREALTVTRA